MNTKLYKIRHKDAIDKIIQEKDLMKLLSEKLFLGESLAGECDPVAYLERSIKEAYLETVCARSRGFLSIGRDQRDAEWLEG